MWPHALMHTHTHYYVSTQSNLDWSPRVSSHLPQFCLPSHWCPLSRTHPVISSFLLWARKCLRQHVHTQPLLHWPAHVLLTAASSHALYWGIRSKIVALLSSFLCTGTPRHTHKALIITSALQLHQPTDLVRGLTLQRVKGWGGGGGGGRN